jgi:uncharacterized membrane protein
VNTTILASLPPPPLTHTRISHNTPPHAFFLPFHLVFDVGNLAKYSLVRVSRKKLFIGPRLPISSGLWEQYTESHTQHYTPCATCLYFLLSLASIQIATDKLAETDFAENKRIAIENEPCS